MDTHRPPLGPGQTAKYPYELQALEGLGLSDLELDAALRFVLGFVETCARRRRGTHLDARDPPDRPAVVGGQRTAAAAHPDAHRYPLAVRVGTAVGNAFQALSNPDHAYTFGLQRVLDGPAALIQDRSRASFPPCGPETLN
ncbi:hypothetical protein HNR42_000453 [Deinobacterium chartae]|uniref:Tetracycline repressor TetR C-terminal domain-containing protein n=2 Tax=Deinobacterium chartae TaxID=521158 RepID=A0A841HXT5_9DEIO|nr:hypothetical protein [Deinobacterium chartae]